MGEKTFLYTAIFILVSLIILACGGDGGGSGGSPSNTTSTVTGQLQASYINGARVCVNDSALGTASEHCDITRNQGNFTLTNAVGKALAVLIDSVSIGTMPADQVTATTTITPEAMSGGDAVRAQKITNIFHQAGATADAQTYAMGAIKAADIDAAALAQYLSGATDTIKIANTTVVHGSVSSYTMIGKVTDSGGKALSGVTISLTGVSAMSTTTGENGIYGFCGALNGNYTLAPTLTGYTFGPKSRSVTVNGANTTGQDFTGEGPPSDNISSLSGWHFRNPLPKGNGLYLNGVAGGDKNFVAVGQGIITSSDGMTWLGSDTYGTAPSITLKDIAYGKGKLLAVGAYDKIRLSSDNGINWQSFSSGLVEHFNAVAYGNGMFVASGTKNYSETGMILTSPDGINWRAAFTGNFIWIYKIAYANGTFVAVGNDSKGGIILTSHDDGITWTTRISGFENSLSALAYGDGIIIVGATGGAILASSDNGITWRRQGTLSTKFQTGMAFGNGIFAVTSMDSATLYSHIHVSKDDGLTWTDISLNDEYRLNNICFGNGLFVAVGAFGIFQSDNF